MSINLNLGTHSKALFSTYQAVLTGDKNTTWVVYGYDKGGNDLKVIETGGGDLDELQEEFDDGKIQYAFVRVIDPNTELPKLILIGWCGEGVPESKKGLFNSHFNDVTKFLKADVDPAYIMKRINESGGSKYSINIDKRPPKKGEPILPVHSVYQPEKIPDITALQRKAPRDEIKPVSSVYQPVQLPKPKPLATRTTWTTTAEEEKTPSMSELKAEKLREDREKEEREKHEQQERERLAHEEHKLHERQERERLAHKEEEQKRQQEEEISNLRLAKEKEDIEREENEHKERLRIQKELEEQALKEKQEQEHQRKKAEEIFRREEQENSQAPKSETVTDIIASADEEDINSTSSFRARVLFSYDADDSNEMTLFEGEIIKDILKLDEGWWQGVSEDETRSGLFPANYVEIIEDDPDPVQEFIQKPDAEQQDAIDENGQNVQSSMYSAIAQYVYEAGESNEISFVEGDLITNIEFVSEDWWQGTASDGTVGLFPEVDDVLGGEEGWKNVDSTEARCPKCEHPRAYYMQIQTRSSDEPMSIFYKCCNHDCEYQWNEK
nr:407_t:CDS:10 [Entrophospora candida]CAG8539087.1 1518_t:CDS:10 [Entrophospora candida]